MDHQFVLSCWANLSKPSALRDMLRTTSRPGIISLALGLPARDLFPTTSFAIAMGEVLAREPLALQYEPSSGALRQYVATLMGQRGVRCSESEVLLTTGSQQALSLLSKLLLNPGGELVLEETLYPGMRSAIEPLQPRIRSISTSPLRGIDIDELETVLKDGMRPAFLYVSAEAHNPMTGRIDLDGRQRLAQLSRGYRFPLIEDDAYGFLTYASSSDPAIRAFDSDWVIYVGTFSKILAPALRVGWIVAPSHVIDKLAILKEANDIDTTTLSQRAICAFLRRNLIESHIECLRREYERRRDVMMEALNVHLSSYSTWCTPRAGVFVWVELLEHIDAEQLLTLALEHGVAFLPGRPFFVQHERRNCLRLSFSNCSEDAIREGVARIGRAIEEYLRTHMSSSRS